MAHFAHVNDENLVVNVVVTPNDHRDGDEGHQWLISNFGGRWIKTSYNATIRKNFASIGHFYNEELDAFIPPKPFESWILDEDSCQWNAPVDMPEDGGIYSWDEESLSWIDLAL